jgi:SET domain-containing protein
MTAVRCAARAPSVVVGPSAVHGRGVFATEPIPAGGMIEVSPVLIVPAEEVAALSQTVLCGYYFSWPGGGVGLALGSGSLYNHSYNANAQVAMNRAEHIISFCAVRPIAAGEEITINYNGDPTDGRPVWFDTRKAGDHRP